MRQSMLALGTALVSMGLASCQTTLAPDPTTAPASASSAEVSPPRPATLLPPNYRVQIAAAFLRTYLSDGGGPAEITAPREIDGVFGQSSTFIIRFPIKRSEISSFLFDTDKPHSIRCLTVSAETGLFSTGNGFRIKRPRLDGSITSSCSTSDPFVPFTELNEMVAKVQACRTNGETKCTLWTKPRSADLPRSAKAVR